jgi:putative dimethyl sulfoxide reductase chaperone
MELTGDMALNTQEMIQMAQARASLYSFASLPFNALPNLAFVQHIRGSAYVSALEALADDKSLPEDVTTGASLMQGFVCSTGDKDESALSDELGVDRTRLYRGVSPSYGPPPPYEAVWTKAGTPVTELLQAVARTYREAGVVLSPETKERIDYVGIQLDFSQQLALREAEAWDAGEPERAKALIQEQLAFLTGHLTHWVPLFVERALPQAQTDFYRGHMRFLRGILASDEERLQAILDELGAKA